MRFALLLLQSSAIDAVCCPERLDGVLIEVTPAFVENAVKETIRQSVSSESSLGPVEETD